MSLLTQYVPDLLGPPPGNYGDDVIEAGDGSISNPAYSFQDELSSGWYRAGAGDVRLSILGADVVKVLAAGVTVTGTITLSSNLVLPDGVRQTFHPNATTPGLNVGANAGDPSAPSNGDLWYDSTGNLLRARINGATVSLGLSGFTSADINTSAKIAAIVTDETGSDALVFANTPTLITPVIGAATGTSLVLTGGINAPGGLSLSSTAPAANSLYVRILDSSSLASSIRFGTQAQIIAGAVNVGMVFESPSSAAWSPTTGNASFKFQGAAAAALRNTGTSGALYGARFVDFGQAAASGNANWIGLGLDYTINNTGTTAGAVAEGLVIVGIETSLTGTTHNLIRARVGATDIFKLENNGNILTGGGATTPRIIFGEATASGVSLKRSTTILQARLGDDSNYTSFDASLFALSGSTTLAASGLFFRNSSMHLQVGSSSAIKFYAVADSFSGGPTPDAGLNRSAAGVVKATDGAAGYGSFESLHNRIGSGSPESVVTAPVGAIFHRTDGGAATSFYVKESGAGNTGWVAK